MKHFPLFSYKVSNNDIRDAARSQFTWTTSIRFETLIRREHEGKWYDRQFSMVYTSDKDLTIDFMTEHIERFLLDAYTILIVDDVVRIDQYNGSLKWEETRFKMFDKDGIRIDASEKSRIINSFK